MVTMSFDAYKHLNDPVIGELNKADALCEDDTRYYFGAQSLKILKERRNAQKYTLDIRYSRSIRDMSAIPAFDISDPYAG